MTKSVSERLADFVQRATYENLPKEVVHQAKRCLLDTCGAVIAGSYHSTSGKIAQNYARSLEEPPKATIIGTHHEISSNGCLRKRHRSARSGARRRLKACDLPSWILDHTFLPRPMRGGRKNSSGFDHRHRRGLRSLHKDRKIHEPTPLPQGVSSNGNGRSLWHDGSLLPNIKLKRRRNDQRPRACRKPGIGHQSYEIRRLFGEALTPGTLQNGILNATG